MFVQWCIYFSCSESHIVSSWVYESHSVFNSLYFFEFSHDSGPGKKKSQFLIHTYNGKRNSAYALKLYKCSFSSDLLFVLMVCRSRSRSSAGQSVRTRRILQEAHEEGRPCPNQLTQTKPCAIRPCYTWLLSDWSPCTVEVWPTLWMLDLRFFFFLLPWCDHVLTKGAHLHHKAPEDLGLLVFKCVQFGMTSHWISTFLKGTLWGFWSLELWSNEWVPILFSYVLANNAL